MRQVNSSTRARTNNFISLYHYIHTHIYIERERIGDNLHYVSEFYLDGFKKLLLVNVEESSF